MKDTLSSKKIAWIIVGTFMWCTIIEGCAWIGMSSAAIGIIAIAMTAALTAYILS